MVFNQEYSESTVARIEIGTNSYEYTFIQDQVDIEVLNLKELSRGLEAELTIYYPLDTPIQSHFKFNFYSASGRRSLVELLARKYTEVLIPWDNIFEYLVQDVVDQWRRPPEVIDINVDPDEEKLEYLLFPLLPKGQPTTIFSQGGVGKSLFCDYLAVLLTYGIASPIGFLPSMGLVNILYIDWEADAQTHKRYIKAIKKGLIDEGIVVPTEHKQIHYLHCEKPLGAYVEYIKYLVKKYQIELIIIDSQMAATSETPHGMTEAQVAGEYYNNIRSFNLTTLTIDHVTKQYMNGDNGTIAPYGSVVKYNRSRSQYELKMDETFDDNEHKEYVLVHKKHNLTRKQAPVGIAVDFHNEGNELKSVTFGACKLSLDIAKKIKSKTSLIKDFIQERGGRAQIKEIAEFLGEDSHDLSSLMAHSKKHFVNISPGLWGLLSNVAE